MKGAETDDALSGPLWRQKVLTASVCVVLGQNLLMEYIRSSLRADYEAEMDNTRVCVRPLHSPSSPDLTH
jgi:hypothetical protein